MLSNRNAATSGVRLYHRRGATFGAARVLARRAGRVGRVRWREVGKAPAMQRNMGD